MTQPQRTPKDEPERIVVSNIAEYGWHAVIEDRLNLPQGDQDAPTDEEFR
jgi:hypothetical protein